jgi:D-apionolactonase
MRTPPSRNALLHGLDDPPQELLPLGAGPLAAALDGIDLRYVRVGDVEIVRRIYVAVRDRSWNTIPRVPADVAVDSRSDSFRVSFSVRHTSGDIDFSWRGRITGSDDGRITYVFDGSAERDLLYNRIGICVLHPPRETAGRPFVARTPGGEIRGQFPLEIGPQRFENDVYVPLFSPFDRLEVELPTGGAVRFEFEGDLWEDEDQRNWTDASFKTYCTPLARGFPHELKAGEKIVQSVTVSADEVPAASPEADSSLSLRVGDGLGRSLPALGLSAAAGGETFTPHEVGLLRSLRLDHLRIEVRLHEAGWEDALRRELENRERLAWPLELALFVLPDHGRELERLASRLASVPVARVLVAHAEGRSATPTETTPPELVELVRAALGDVPVGGGSDMNFCELNRTRPQAVAMDAVFYAIVPQVHAFDDLSLVETPEAQGETVTSALALAEGKPVVVSPVTLKRRFNPHATVAEAEPEEGELPDSVDPRQLSLLGAAWTLASVKYLAEAGASGLTYYETVGPRGVAERDAGSPFPERFPSVPGAPFPLYHVLADLGEWKGAELCECAAADPLAVVGLAVRRSDGRTSLLVANLKPERQTVRIEGVADGASVRRLDEETAALAASDTTAFRSFAEPAGDLTMLELAPFETVRLDTYT